MERPVEGSTTEIETAIRNGLKRLFGEVQSERSARECGFVQRLRELLPHELLLSLLTTLGTRKVTALAEIHRAYQAATGSSIEYKPFHNQLRKEEFADWMRELFDKSLSVFNVATLAPEVESKLSRFSDIEVHDGSSMAIHFGLAEEYPGRFTKVSPAAIELHVTMSGATGLPTRVTLAPDSHSEHHYHPCPSTLKGKLILLDRGYEDHSYYADISEKQGHYVGRGKVTGKPTILEARDERGKRLRHLERKRLVHKILPRHNVDLVVQFDKRSTPERVVIIYNGIKERKKQYTRLYT